MMTCAFAQLPGGSGSDFLNVAARGIKIPLYNKGELRFMLRAGQFEQHGKQLFANDAIIDIVKKNADIDNMQLGTSTIYRINAPIYEVALFWSKRSGSDGVISSPLAKVDSVRRTAEGSDVVQVRTPMMDIDGVGFTANYETKQVSIPQNVHIVLRFGGKALSDAIEKNLPESVRGNEKAARFADVWADSMFIDFESKKVSLEGSVSFEESGAIIGCDKVVLHLGADDREPAADDGADELDDLGVSGVSLLECFGNVKMERANPSDPDNPQTVKSDYAAYDFAGEKIVLSGGRPSVASGNSVLSGNSISFTRRTGMLNVDGDCFLALEIADKPGEKPRSANVSSDKMEFSYEQNRAAARGNVKIEDSRGSIFAPELEIILAGAPAAKVPETESDRDVVPGIGGMDFDPGSKTVESIRCLGGVNFFGKDGGEGAAETVNYNVDNGAITLTGKSRPWVRQNGNRLEGGSISLTSDSGKLLVKDNAEILLAGANGQTKATADTLEFDYEAGTGVMTGNVRIADGEAKVECDRMNVYLKDKPGADGGKNLTEGLESREFDKIPDRVVCAGNVRGSDTKGSLECETLTVKFTGHADGGIAIDRIDFSGGVKASASDFSMIEQSAPDAAAAAATKTGKPSTMTSDSGFINLSENYAEFNGNVRMIDERVALASDKFNAYFIDRTPEVIAAENSPVAVEPESPELALEPKFESKVPRHIKIGEDKSLTRLLFTGNVNLNGVDDEGNEFSAKGENGSYSVADRMVRMTEENGVKPRLASGGTVVECEEVEVDLSGDMPLPSGRNQRIISFAPDWGE